MTDLPQGHVMAAERHDSDGTSRATTGDFRPTSGTPSPCNGEREATASEVRPIRERPYSQGGADDADIATRPLDTSTMSTR